MVRFRKSDDIPEVAITVSFETFFRTTVLIVTTIILLQALHKASHAILIIFIAFFFALALNGPVYALSRRLPGKRKGSRSLATSLSFLVVILLLAGFLVSIVPPLVRQTQNFVDAAPTLVRDFRSQDSQPGKIIRKYNLEKQVDSLSDQLAARTKDAGGAAFSTIQRISSSAFALLTILVLTFMMLVEGPRWVRFGRELVPESHKDTADRLAQDMYRVIRGFVNGQVTLAALAAVLIVPVLLILDISYPVALMVVVFVCGLIPMVGHTIGAIIVSIVALFESTSAALIILTYYILYQQIENYAIQPRIQANSTNMSPLLVFVSVVVGVSFGGLVGGLLAIPVAGCLRILLLEYLRHQNIISTPQYEKETKVGTK